MPLKIFAYALFNLFYDKEKDINDLPLFLKASVIAILISGASDSAYSCTDNGLIFLNGTKANSSNELPIFLALSDLPSPIELISLNGLAIFDFICYSIYID